MNRYSVAVFKSLTVLLAFFPALALPPGFVDLQTAIPEVRLDVRYATDNNFLAQKVDGYLRPKVFLTHPTALALARVQEELKPFGLGIKVFDGFRPQRAVNHFVRWSQDASDTRNQAAYYPDLKKTDLFPKGYIAEKSGHSRGSTVDLTLVDLKTGQELDMGAPFDFFGPISHPDATQPNAQARANRLLLRSLMLKQGFKPLAEEWWHFTLKDEPFPDTYFDFPVE